jgi:hypothetical protein
VSTGVVLTSSVGIAVGLSAVVLLLSGPVWLDLSIASRCDDMLGVGDCAKDIVAGIAVGAVPTCAVGPAGPTEEGTLGDGAFVLEASSLGGETITDIMAATELIKATAASD